MSEDKPEEGSGTPTNDTVSKNDAPNRTLSPAGSGSQSSENVWIQSVEDKKNTIDSSVEGSLDISAKDSEKEYKQYETKLEEKEKDIEKGEKKEEEKRPSIASSSGSDSSDSSGASELAALKREITVRKSRMDIETLSLMAKLERKKKKQRQRLIGLAVFVLLCGGIFGAIFALT